MATLSGVVSARIVADQSGSVDAIHVLVSGDATPKQMVRNIESALMAQLGMRVDHRKISVATTVRRPSGPTERVVLEEEAAPAAEVASPGRTLYFEDVEVRGSRTKGVLCEVTLRRGAEHLVGEAEGVDGDRSRVELAARAVLAAISMVDGADRRLSLEGAKVINASDRQLVLVGVMVRQGRQSTLLTGSCEVKDSAETASALAVLNATNRWVGAVK